ncbi:lysyl oxidase family protein [Candidatus Leptofilum sp.]|uniref:lysyl oxidase family protein n=1 Tax=Candidatus Leptofilum sp. TaxID=3241576 RepID=UPI003B5B0991
MKRIITVGKIIPMNKLMRFATGFCFIFLILAVSCSSEPPLEEASDADVSSTSTAVSPTTESTEGTPLPPPAVATTLPTSTPPVVEETTTASGFILSPIGEEGALVSLTLNSQVGILLDEYPEEMRGEVADALAAESDAFWVELAQRQVALTHNRLHFRPFFYANKGQLPLPPQSLWHIELTGEPTRQTINGHEFILIDYSFSGTLLTGQDEPGKAEPALAEVGGIWDEPFILPPDPTQLLQRTGNACINEGGFPPNSYDSENVDIFYDYTCTADSGGAAGCHRTILPALSCLQALNGTVGTVETAVRFQRLEWDEDLANQIRIGEVVSEDAPDLLVVSEDLQNYRVVYRYFPSNSCALAEGCVNGTGWRRLLQFDATAHNLGAAPLDIGPVVAENPLTNMLEYNSCHAHFHFQNYGEFQLGTTSQPSKQAFCVESTSRFSNNELSPLTHDFSCTNQGIQAGWVDEYGAGLDCQWIDITDLEIAGEGTELPLSFRFNTEQFLCEGYPVLDEAGQPVFEPSGLRNSDGLPISRPQCDFVDDWDATNSGTETVTIPATGSFVTQPCASSEHGPRRNCGFTAVPLPNLPEASDPEEPSLRCTPGSTVQLSCTIEGDAEQVVRLCETSAALGVGTACTFTDSLLNQVISGSEATLSFTCPFVRDENEPGGDYALYSAPLFAGDAFTQVTCAPVQ